MARARNIKPGFFTNEELSEADYFVRLLFIGLWTLADRRGVFELRPKRIKVQLFPYDDIPSSRIVDGINDLERLGFVEQYQSGTVSLCYIKNFSKHQNPHKNEGENGFSLKNKENGSSTGAAPEQHRSSTGAIRMKDERGKRKDERGKINTTISDIEKPDSDIPTQTLTIIDPNFVIKPGTANTLEEVKFVDICLKLEALSCYEVYGKNWGSLARLLFQGLTLEVLAKAVAVFVDMESKKENKRRFLKHYDTVEAIQRLSEYKLKQKLNNSDGRKPSAPESNLPDLTMPEGSL